MHGLARVVGCDAQLDVGIGLLKLPQNTREQEVAAIAGGTNAQPSPTRIAQFEQGLACIGQLPQHDCRMFEKNLPGLGQDGTLADARKHLDAE